MAQAARQGGGRVEETQGEASQAQGKLHLIHYNSIICAQTQRSELDRSPS